MFSKFRHSSVVSTKCSLMASRIDMEEFVGPTTTKIKRALGFTHLQKYGPLHVANIPFRGLKSDS